ncbi:pilus assembly protein CpaE [Promicromonospora sp. AC04]|uniref:MinD/ParA family protein n=1 Tax=Promicromonospora sp. AC04 TaxID=2135723 RepID=UPI000D39A13A|nr:MinD/ParA family protein [Promicromonospora sp. AC04]PUB30161.1 pilus assembly protein CpaE [Promicromonospora sp. AC04]
MVTKVLLATASREVRDHLGHVFAESDQFELAAAVPDGAGALTALDRHPDVGIVVVDEAADDGHGHALARTVGLAAPLIGIVMVVDAHGPAEMNEAMASAMEVGARSVIARNAGLEEVLTRFEAVASWSTVARAAIAAERNGGRSGQVVVVAGAKGGVGTSVLALLLARAGRTGDTTLVDFDLGAGDLAAYAGVRTRRSVVDLAGVEGEVTARMLRETTYEVGGGLRLLTAPNDGERGEEMTPAAARSIVSALRFESNLAVLDVGAHLDEPRATAIEFADRVLLVTTPDLPALRAARRVIAQWDRLAIRRPTAVELVLNRRTSRDEVTPQLAERIVERPVAFTVPDGGSAFTGAVNTATLLETPTPVHAAVAEVGIAAISPEAGPVRPDDPAEVAALVAGTARRNGRSGSDQKRSARLMSREKRADPEAGQSTVELPVVILMALTALLLCAQAIGWATGLLTARAVAQEGARTVGIVGYYDRYGNPRDEVIERVRDDAREQLPSWMSSIDDSDIDVLADRVSIRVTVSTVIPGVDLSASSSAPVYRGG